MNRARRQAARRAYTAIAVSLVALLLPALSEGQRRPRRNEPNVVLQSSASPRSVFVGQQFLYSLDLYTQSDIEAINPDRLPEFPTAWVQEIPQPEQLKPIFTELRGERFGKVPILQRAVFPLRQGTLQVSSASAFLEVQTSHVLDENGLRSETTEVRRESNALRVRVKPLAAGAPAGFAGAVGEFQLTAEIDRTEVAVGQSLRLTIELEGDGNLQTLPDLRLPPLEGMRAFEPERTVEQEIRGSRVFGKRSWRYVLTADTPGTQTLPSIPFHYFDPQSGTYGTLYTDPIGWLAVAPLEPVARFDRGDLAPSSSWRWVSRLGIGLLLAGIAAISLHRRTRAGRSSALLRQLGAVDPASSRSEFASELEAVLRTVLGSEESIRLAANVDDKKKAAREIAARQTITQILAELSYLTRAPELAARKELAQDLLERSRRVARNLRNG